MSIYISYNPGSQVHRAYVSKIVAFPLCILPYPLRLNVHPIQCQAPGRS